MTSIMLLCAGVIILCIVAERFSDKFGMPALVFFMILGMLCGSDGILKIDFNDYHITEQVCSIALVFIMFYGGFGTKWDVAKSVVKKSIILSNLGVVITAFLTAIFCNLILKFTLLESFLIGSVISSTDAASVFSILRLKKLDLKDGTSSMLELESGSNDPAAYMMTIIVLTIMQGESSTGKILYLLFSQIVYGVLIGVLVAFAGIFTLKKLKVVSDGLDTIFTIAIVLIAFALPSFLGGNGFLSVYLTGIILGNSSIKNKIILVHFFDGITILAQILMFFLIGLLSSPAKLPETIIPAVLIAIFLSFVARPLAVFSILKPFKASINQILIVSWSGLRGAASIVFAMIAITHELYFQYDLFHIVFTVSFLSVAFQGSLLPFVARKLDMVDEKCDVLKTFNDYQEKSPITMVRLFIGKDHVWKNKTIEEINLPKDSLALMIKRKGEILIPKGDTLIKENDSLILSISEYEAKGEINLKEIKIDKASTWCNKCIEDLNLDEDVLIAMVKRKDETIIPRGKTLLLEDDIVVIYN